jgi:hypothetical protein
MEAEGSLRLSQVPATCPYPEPARYANERLYFIAAKSDIFVEKKLISKVTCGKSLLPIEAYININLQLSIIL